MGGCVDALAPRERYIGEIAAALDHAGQRDDVIVSPKTGLFLHKSIGAMAVSGMASQFTVSPKASFSRMPFW
jgi:hypothetical protein